MILIGCNQVMKSEKKRKHSFQLALEYAQQHINKFTPDLRRCLVYIQRYCRSNSLGADESTALFEIIRQGLLVEDHHMVVDENSIHDVAFIHLHTLHWQILQLLRSLITCKRLVSASAELLNMVKKKCYNSDSSDNYDVAMKVMCELMSDNPEKLISELLDLLHQAKSMYEMNSAVACLTDVLTDESHCFSFERKSKIIKHFIPQLRMEYAAHKTVLICFQKIWHSISDGDLRDYIDLLFYYAQNNSGEIRQAIVRLFLEVNLQRINIQNLNVVVNRISALFSNENDVNFCRFACEALRRIQSEVATPNLAKKIMLILIEHVEVDKLKVRVSCALDNLKLTECVNVLATRSRQAKQFIDRLLVVLSDDDYTCSSKQFLRDILDDERFVNHHERIRLALAHYRRTTVRFVEAPDSKNQVSLYRSDRGNKGNLLFHCASDIFHGIGGDSQRHKNLFTLLDTISRDENLTNCWHALRECVAIFDKLSEDQQRKMVDTLLGVFRKRPKLRHNILSNLSAMCEGDFFEEIFRLYVETYNHTDDECLSDLCKEILLGWSFIPRFFRDRQQLSIDHLKLFGQIKIRFGDIEVVEQLIDLCMLCCADNKAHSTCRVAALEAVLSIAANLDNVIVLLKIIDSIQGLNTHDNLTDDLMDVLDQYHKQSYPCGYRLGWSALWAIAEGSFQGQQLECQLEQGLSAFNNKDYYTANQCFFNATMIEHHDVDAYLLHFYRGRALLAMGQPIMAIKFFDIAQENYRDIYYSQLHYYRALAYIAIERFDDAIRDLNDAVRHYPCFLAAHEKLVETYYRLHHIRQARQAIEDIHEFLPEYTGSEYGDVVRWLSVHVGNYSLSYFPKQSALDALYLFIESYSDTLAQHADDVIARVVEIFGQTHVDKVAGQYGFCKEELNKIEYSSEVRRYVLQFIQALLLKTFWQEYHHGYKVLTSEQERQVDLRRLAEESQILNIFNEISVAIVNDVESMLTVINQDCCGAYGIFDFLRQYGAEVRLGGGVALGATSDIGSTYSVLTRLLGLRRWESVYGQYWIYDSCNDRIDNTSYGEYKIINSGHHTDQFFQKIIQEDVPIIFFVPTNMGAKENIDGVTYGEIAWVAQAIKEKRTDLLKNIIFVFDAYNYLPLHILREANPGQLNPAELIVGENLLSVVSQYIADKVIDRENKEKFNTLVRANLNQDQTNIIRYEILTEVILLVRHNSLHINNNDNAKTFLDMMKYEINDWFNNQSPACFIKNITMYCHEALLVHSCNEINIVYIVALMRILLSDRDYAPYLQLNNKEVSAALTDFLEQIISIIAPAKSMQLGEHNQKDIVDDIALMLEQHPTMSIADESFAVLLIISIGRSTQHRADIYNFFKRKQFVEQRNVLQVIIKLLENSDSSEAISLYLTTLITLFQEPLHRVLHDDLESNIATILKNILRHNQPGDVYSQCLQLLSLVTPKLNEFSRIDNWLPYLFKLSLLISYNDDARRIFERCMQYHKTNIATSLRHFFISCDQHEKYLMLEKLRQYSVLICLPISATISLTTMLSCDLSNSCIDKTRDRLKNILNHYQALLDASEAVPKLCFTVMLKRALHIQSSHVLSELLVHLPLIEDINPTITPKIHTALTRWLEYMAMSPHELTRNNENFVIKLFKKHADVLMLDARISLLSLFVNGLLANKFIIYANHSRRGNKKVICQLMRVDLPSLFQDNLIALLENMLSRVDETNNILSGLLCCLSSNNQQKDMTDACEQNFTHKR